jgi:cell division protein FtsL
MSTWLSAETVAEPVARPRPRPQSRRRAQRRARARGGILWIAVSGILLAGVVFVNVAVLRLNISLDSANTQRAKLRAQNAALQSELASTLASPRIQNRAHVELGLVPADPSTIRYLNLAP